MWIETSPGQFWLAKSVSSGLFRGPTILMGQNGGAHNTPGAQVQNVWLVGLVNRHIAKPEERVPAEAAIAFVGGMFVGGVRPGGQSSMVLIDFSDADQPTNPAVWPGEQGALYAAISGSPGTQLRQAFGIWPIPLRSFNGSPGFWLRWGTTGDLANPAGYNTWLLGYAMKNQPKEQP